MARHPCLARKLRVFQSFLKMGNKPKVVLLTGPTASGKTEMAVRLAKEFQGEILSVDSRQVFQGMDLGSGKDLHAYDGVPYHLIDLLPAGADFSVRQFQEQALKTLRQVAQKKRLPILCGGSGHYLKALAQDYHFTHPPTDLTTSLALESLSKKELLKRLQELEQDHQKNWSQESKRRLARWIEKKQQEKKSTAPPNFAAQYDYQGFYLEPERNELRKRIEERLALRFSQGLAQEVEGLLSSGVPATRLKRYGLEYKWITCHLLGEIESAPMQNKLALEIKKFAKRQMTFIRYMQKEGMNLREVKNYEDLQKRVRVFLET